MPAEYQPGARAFPAFFMTRIKSEEIADERPVLHTPRGASPRGLRSDTFVGRPAMAPPSAVPGAEEFEERIPELLASGQPAPAGVRDWDFAVPEPVRQQVRDPLMDPDANRRHQTGLRTPVDTPPLPEFSRERFSENWQRLAAEPARKNRSRVRRSFENSTLTRWMFSHGRFELGVAVGSLLLLALLVAAFIYGHRILGGDERSPAPAAEKATGSR